MNVIRTGDNVDKKNYKLRVRMLFILILLCISLSSCTKETIEPSAVENLSNNESPDKESDSSIQDSEISEDIKELTKKAEEGDSDSQNTLAYYYFNGYGVKQDYKKSFEWSLKSAENGNLASMFNVGYDYYHGFHNEVNYELAFEWYKKAADKSYPKALNALGEMYYSGKGTEKNIDLALDFTLQSAGLLHSYSLSNMGIMIKELELNQDSNMWFRLASKNYKLPTSSNNMLYEALVSGKRKIKTDYKIESENIPKDLIQDILYKYYSGTLYNYLEASSEQYKSFDIEGLNIDEDTHSMLEYSRWYDASYLIDIDSDGIEELLVYKLDGTMGTSSMSVLKEIDGKFTYSDNYVSYDLMHGLNGIITHDNQRYFVVGNIDIGNRSISSVSMYSFNEGMLSDSVLIKTMEKDTDVIKTYQKDESYNELVKLVENRINEMFVHEDNSLLYEKLNETVTLDVDVNNDGMLEHYEYEAMLYGTINRPLILEFKDELTSEEDRSIIDEVLKFGDYTIPIGLEVFNYNEKNYISVLSYDLGTNNHCLTTFLTENNKVNMIANHLIALQEEFIIGDNDMYKEVK